MTPATEPSFNRAANSARRRIRSRGCSDRCTTSTRGAEGEEEGDFRLTNDLGARLEHILYALQAQERQRLTLADHSRDSKLRADIFETFPRRWLEPSGPYPKATNAGEPSTAARRSLFMAILGPTQEDATRTASLSSDVPEHGFTDQGDPSGPLHDPHQNCPHDYLPARRARRTIAHAIAASRPPAPSCIISSRLPGNSTCGGSGFRNRPPQLNPNASAAAP